MKCQPLAQIATVLCKAENGFFRRRLRCCGLPAFRGYYRLAMPCGRCRRRAKLQGLKQYHDCLAMRQGLPAATLAAGHIMTWNVYLAIYLAMMYNGR